MMIRPAAPVVPPASGLCLAARAAMTSNTTASAGKLDLESRITASENGARPTMIRPLYDRILAKRVAEDSKTSGGLFIPDSAREKPLEAVVISVGSGKRLDNGTIQPIAVKVGDRILVAMYAGSEVKLVGKEHVILREDDILAVFEDDAS
jgi:chaperonin GroES